MKMGRRERPILQGCCCCCDLETGCTVIGALHLVGSLLCLIACLAVLIVGLVKGGYIYDRNSLENMANEQIGDLSRLSQSHNVGDALSNLNDWAQNTARQSQHLDSAIQSFGRRMKPNPEQNGEALIFILSGSIGTLVSFVFVTTSSMLIHGIRKSRRGFLIPWMIQSVLALLVSFGMSVCMLASAGSDKQMIISAFIVLIIDIPLPLYFLLVVISAHQSFGLRQLQDDTELSRPVINYTIVQLNPAAPGDDVPMAC